MQKCLNFQTTSKGTDYPVHKKDFIQHVKKPGASKEVMDVLESLPDKEFKGK
jgi:hypothetical protein